MNALRFLVPVIVLGTAIGLATALILTRPEPPQRPQRPSITDIDATRLSPTNYSTEIKSQGTVQPRTESTLIPEVAGRLVSIAPNFRPGGFFETGDVLAVIEPDDYKTAVVVAEATLAQATAALQTERARGEQALENWNLLSEGKPAPDLVLRKPQLAEATAAAASAEARLKQARRDLERTQIVAPYAGRILDKQVDIGQYVAPGTILASIYSIDYAEVRLPVSKDQLVFIDVPEQFRGENSPSPNGPSVILSDEIAGKEITWKGTIVRAEGAVDKRNRQLYLIAQINDPYGRKESGTPPLKVGAFVNARISGRTLPNVFVIPRLSIRQGNEILLVTRTNTLERRLISPLFTDEKHVLVDEGFKNGDVLCLTPVPYAADGIAVSPTIDGVAPKRPSKPKPGNAETPGKGGKP